MRRKLTDDFFIQLQNILESEEEKKKILGTNKQCLTKIQIYEILRKSGFNIGYSTVVAEINKIKRSGNECFIRQHYEFGDRLEYDFGEVKLVINGITKKYYIAVLSSPAGNFRWCYIYDNCKKDVFLDSHVEFFKMIGGVWKELVYDNMRNVVTKFIGKNEKELNEDLIKMSIYYGFDINVTNAFSGNEKGYVEGSVKYLRNKIFAENYKFSSEEAAIEYMESQLIKLNENGVVNSTGTFGLIPANERKVMQDYCKNLVSYDKMITQNSHKLFKQVIALSLTEDTDKMKMDEKISKIKQIVEEVS